MTAEYEITHDDLSAFNLYHNRHSPTARRHYLRSWLLPPLIWLLVCAIIVYLAGRQRGTPLRSFLDLLPLFSGIPLYLLYFPWAYRRKLRKIIAGMVGEGHNRGLFGRHRVTISPEGVNDWSEHSQTSRTWRAVERVAASDDYVYLYVSALTAIIIPARAFADRSKFKEFVQAAMAYHAKAVP